MNVGDKVVSTETLTEFHCGSPGTIIQVYPRGMPYRYEVCFDYDGLPFLVTPEEITFAPN